MDVKKNFGKRLKELRVKHDLTQEELGEKVSLSARMISSLENGKTFISSDILENLSNLFEVPPRYFFDDVSLLKDEEDKLIAENIKQRVDELNSSRLKDIYNIIVALND
mgnify:FL=1